MEFLSLKETERAMKLASNIYRPSEIIKLKEEIEGEIRAGELALSITGIIDSERVEKIVKMKLQLDGLYVAWAKGEIK